MTRTQPAAARQQDSHAHVFCRCRHRCRIAGKEVPEAEAALATALQRGRPAWIRSYASSPACAGRVLTYLPEDALTSLSLGQHADSSSGPALEGFTQLHNLELRGDSAGLLLPWASGLANLTRCVALMAGATLR